MSHKAIGIKAETALRGILQARGYIVVRSAASKCLDLVCVRPRPHPSIGIEVKSTGVCRLDLRKNSRVQWDDMCSLEKANYKLYYAVMWRNTADGKGMFELFHPRDGPIFRMGTGISLDDVLPDRVQQQTLACSPQHTPYSPPEAKGYPGPDGGGYTD